MARKLAYTVHVSETKPVDPDKPDGDRYVVRQEMFERGQELPEWAVPFVGPHVFEKDDTAPAPVALNGAADGRSPAASPEAPESQDGDAPEQPAGNASLEDWQKFAKSLGATDEELDGKGRDQLRDEYGS